LKNEIVTPLLILGIVLLNSSCNQALVADKDLLNGPLRKETIYSIEDYYAKESLEYELIIAIINNRIDDMRMLIANGANVNAKSKEEMTPLMFAYGARNLEAAKELLKHGANPNFGTKNGFSVANWLVYEPEQFGIPWYRELAKYGFSPDILITSYTGELYNTAITHNRLDYFRLFMSLGGDIIKSEALPCFSYSQIVDNHRENNLPFAYLVLQEILEYQINLYEESEINRLVDCIFFELKEPYLSRYISLIESYGYEYNELIHN
jgi:ankyrin repeat protein